MQKVIGTLKSVAFIAMLIFSAFAKAQSPQDPSTKQYRITAEDDRASIFKITDELKAAYNIQTKFKGYKLNNNKLSNLELEFIPENGKPTLMVVNGANGIEPQTIQVNASTNQISYAGATSGLSQSKENNTTRLPATETALKTPTATPPKPAATKTYSIRSPKVTDPSELDASQIDKNDPSATATRPKTNTPAQDNQLSNTEIADRQKAAAVEQAAYEARKVKAAAELKLQEQEMAQKAIADKKALQEEKAKQEALLAAQKAQQKANDAELARKAKTAVSKTTDAKNDARVANASSSPTMEEREKLAAEVDDAESMRHTLEDLNSIKKIEETKIAKPGQGYVFINAVQYNYEVYKGKERTVIYDSMDRTVLIIPAELDDRTVSGQIAINGLRYQFNYSNNIITLKNGAGELVDLNGKIL